MFNLFRKQDDYTLVLKKIADMNYEIATLRVKVEEMDTHIALFAQKVSKMRKIAVKAIEEPMQNPQADQSQNINTTEDDIYL